MTVRKQQVSLEELAPVMREILAAGGSFRFYPRGISMLPMLRQGIDTVVLSPLPDRLKKYDVVLYRRSDGNYILHRILKAAQTYTCVGDNQFVMEKGVTHDQMIAVVTAFFRDGKEYRVDALSYRIYCRVWYFSRPLRRLVREARKRSK